MAFYGVDAEAGIDVETLSWNQTTCTLWGPRMSGPSGERPAENGSDRRQRSSIGIPGCDTTRRRSYDYLR